MHPQIVYWIAVRDHERALADAALARRRAGRAHR